MSSKLSFEIPPIRLGLYAVLTIFAFILMCISAARLHFTTGVGFYDPIVAELLFTALITISWSIFVVLAMFKRFEFGFVTTFLGEIVALAILWLFWLVGAAVASSIWGDLSFCQQLSQCRLLTAMLAFAWLGWITLTALLVVTVLFSIANSALWQPLHGRWDPRISMYSSTTRV
ncbi:hypothetical protein P691DRAFT_725466 [Macrolepiota fuliginosa MF-IS2]|uniref:MARVEL domain-containing protein n=1 Tax=Macrolepiota fuliginosa MF-IS2 TaxID=1400762 RepID=A0A9P5XI13_9AGAR|nr:hypothetical protein P691DRAFT_725466 [Macrolepiota fuliginosa MF-IS2]